MRPVVVIVISLIGLALVWPFLVGFARSLRRLPAMSHAVGVPRVDVESAPCVATPGDVILIRVRSRDADTCRLGWGDRRARDIPGAERDVALDGTVQWRLRVPPGLQPGTRALVVTAHRGSARTRVRIPVHVLDAGSATAHAAIPHLDLPDVPVAPAGASIAARTRRFGELAGLYRPAVEASVLEARMLDASVTSSVDAAPALFDAGSETSGTPAADRESAAS